MHVHINVYMCISYMCLHILYMYIMMYFIKKAEETRDMFDKSEVW